MTPPPIGFWGLKPIAAFAGVFTIIYNDGDQETLDRALDVAATCEADLEWMEGIFQCNYHSAPYSTIIWLGQGGGAASNNGYSSEVSPGIYINSTYNPSGLASVAPEVVRMLFVAEMAEILMDFTGYGWDRKSSHGEALSVLLATLRHPVGYYNSAAGPRITKWLDKNPRPDFLTKNSSDTDDVAYGSGLIGLYYLTSQLGHPLTDMVRAGGNNCAETFSRLTGRDSSQAFPEISTFLEKHLPAGFPVNPPIDDVFPLFPENLRKVNLDIHEVQITDARDPNVKRADLAAGPQCDAKSYEYFEHDRITRISAVTRGLGFANASFEWFVNGQVLPTTDAWASAELKIEITDSSPNRPETPFDAIVPVRYFIHSSWNKSTISVQNSTSPGNGNITFTAVALENNVVGESASQAKSDYPFVSRWYEMGQAFLNDTFTCNPHAVLEIASDISVIGREMSIIKTLPDPGPDDVRQLGVIVASVETNVAGLTFGKHGMRRAILAAAERVAPAQDVLVQELKLSSKSARRDVVGQVQFGDAPPK
jgi:hypothetical protein